MTDNSFDKFIREKLQDYSSPLQPSMWQKVKPGRTAFPLKRLIVAFVLVASLSFIGYLTWNGSKKPAGITRKEGGSDKTSTSPNRNSKYPVISSPANKENRKLLTGDPVKTKKEEQNAVPGEAKATTAGISILSIQRQRKGSHLIVEAEKSAKTSSASNNNLIQQETRNEENEKYALKKYEYPLSNIGKLLATDQKQALHLQENKQLAKQLKHINLSCVVDCPPARRFRRNRLYLEVFASPDYAIKKISGNATLNPDYLGRKDSSETIGTAFTAGFRLSKSLGNVVIKTGLQYSQINEVFRYRSENEKRLTTIVTLRTIIRSQGDTLRVSDTSLFEQTGYRNKINQNRYRRIDIPVLVGYEWSNSKFRAGVNAGVIFNLYSWQTGQLLDTAYRAASFDKNNRLYFKNNMGIGLYAGLSFTRIIRAQTELFAEPYFRYNFASMTRDDSPFNQKFNVAGINLGVRYKLRIPGQRY